MGVVRLTIIKNLKMIKELFLCFLLIGVVINSPVPSEESSEDVSSGESGEDSAADRGLIEDLLINLIRDMVINQINGILGITTTTTPCSGLIGGGLLCP